jgi:hypothetical protein
MLTSKIEVKFELELVAHGLFLAGESGSDILEATILINPFFLI